MATREERNKPCPQCGTAVNRQLRVCPACGTISPWRVNAEDLEPLLGAAIEVIPPEPEPESEAPRSIEDEAVLSRDEMSELLAGQVAVELLPGDYGPHIVMRDDRVLIGDVLVPVKAGQVVEGHARIVALKSKGVPLAPVDEAPGFACCPHCGTVFDARRPVAPPDRPGTMAADRIATLERAERAAALETAAGARYRAGVEEEERRGGFAA